MELLVLTAESDAGTVLPALSLLAHSVSVAAPAAAALTEAGGVDAVIVDARLDLAGSRTLCRLFAENAPDTAVLLVITEGGLIALTADWSVADFMLTTIGPAELDARLRLFGGRRGGDEPESTIITMGELVIDEATYTTRLRGRTLDLTYKEFELLKFLAQHAGRVFTRAQLLHEVWGYDYFGGTRTVDVHVRRLRAKLGTEYESLIGTVRNVGYKAVPAPGSKPRDPS